MTEENYRYRTDPLFLRDQFSGPGLWRMPVIPKSTFSEEEFLDLRLIGFDRTKEGEARHYERMVHFFLYDYKFERVWKDPKKDLERLKPYRAILSPDFSMYLEMAPVMQLYNVFRNRWCGAYYADKGLRIIPTVSWGDESTFDFCFEWIPKGSTVAVSTYMVTAHGNHADQKEFFMKGYSELLRRIEPERILCYNKGGIFPEMEGNIISIDYDLSSWMYQDKPSKYLPYICGERPLPEGSGLIIKRGYVLPDHEVQRGMGSAYGGAWKPKKKTDKRFLGKPGEIKPETIPGKKGSYNVETHIGPDGRADRERHYSDHHRPDKHSNPHDHEIDWSKGFPDPQPPINYEDGEAPTFMDDQGGKAMSVDKKRSEEERCQRIEENRFETISDFKWCVTHGGEVEFEGKGHVFGICPKLRRTPDGPIQMLISEIYIDDPASTELWGDTADDILEYTVAGDRLRDVITQVTVYGRTI